MSVRVAVVGCGVMGSHHVRLWAERKDCTLVGVYDRDESRAAELAGRYECEVLPSVEAVLGVADAASVAVPTRHHREIGEILLRGGVDVLVEKPIAATVADADALLAAAGAHRILGVGHTERFNPAVVALMEETRDPRFLEVHRLGAFPHRSTDVDAVLDLMIHDLDIVLRLVDRPVLDLQAVGVPVLTGQVDIANARLCFEGGCVANITASRVSQKKERKIRLFQADTYISVDYVERSGKIVTLDRNHPKGPAIVEDTLNVLPQDPLEAELGDFLAAVRDRRPPAVPGWEGRRALEAAIHVRDTICESLGNGPEGASARELPEGQPR